MTLLVGSSAVIGGMRDIVKNPPWGMDGKRPCIWGLLEMCLCLLGSLVSIECAVFSVMISQVVAPRSLGPQREALERYFRWFWLGWLVALSSLSYSLSGQVADVSEALIVNREHVPGLTRFTPMASSQTGITFRNDLDEWRGAANRVLFNGSGVAVGDLDGDGWPDLFFCGIDSENQLYRNRGGWTFVPVPLSGGLARAERPSRGVVFADLNGDGRLDVLLTTVGGGVRAFFNRGEFQFVDRTEWAGLDGQTGATSVCLADIDRNGTLDLYVVNYRSDDIRDRARVPVTRVGGRLMPAETLRDRVFIRGGQIHEYGEADQLYLNDGRGKFTVVDWRAGVFRVGGQSLDEVPRDWGLSAMFRDVNRDGWPDLYVCNDYWSPDRFWINDGKGSFDALDPRALSVSSASSMGVDGADIDLDGDWDLFVVDMLSRDLATRKRQQAAVNLVAGEPELGGPRRQVNRNTLLMNVGETRQRFVDLAQYAGLEASDWSWCPIFIDVDLDGYEDVLVSAGYPHDMQDLDTLRRIQERQHRWNPDLSEAARQRAFTREMMEHIRLYPSLKLPVVAFRNQGDGTFEDMTASWGTHHVGVNQGFATGDLDGDGDWDLVINRLNDVPLIYRNNATEARVAVRLIGKGANTQAIGAEVSLRQGAAAAQLREVIAGGRYLSGSDTLLCFGIAVGPEPIELTVRWPDGSAQVQFVRPDHLYRLSQTSDILLGADSASDTPRKEPLFRDESQQLAFDFKPGTSNEFQQQPLLPWSLSNSGPGVICLDVDRDGVTDIVFGAEYAQRPHLFYGRAGGGFAPASFKSGLWNDSTGMLGMGLTSGRTHLFVGQSGYETPGRAGLLEFRLSGEQRSLFQGSILGAGSLAAGPRLGDGSLSLFVGGYVEPNRYPKSWPAVLIEPSPRGWRVDEGNRDIMTSIRRAQGVVWSDLTADGFPELVVATEWGPVRVFENQRGRLIERTGDWGWEEYTGLWKGVATADFDGNGYLDIMVGNWGRNSSLEASSAEPLTLVVGEFARQGVLDILETEYRMDGVIVPSRGLTEIGRHLPFLARSVKGFAAYSEASVEALLGSRFERAERLEVRCLESMVFMNQGRGRFLVRPLPPEVQWAPVFGLQCGDFNADGHEDAILCQNRGLVRSGLAPQDQGRALVLLGDGRGGFRILGDDEAGISEHGDLRSVALADFNRDARMDLVLTQNDGAARLYLGSESVEPGLRVIIQGPKENPFGIGSQLRLIDDVGALGPVREIQAGSGWWAQNDPVTVLATGAEARALWIRWPGGDTAKIPLSPGDRSITVLRRAAEPEEILKGENEL